MTLFWNLTQKISIKAINHFVIFGTKIQIFDDFGDELINNFFVSNFHTWGTVSGSFAALTPISHGRSVITIGRGQIVGMWNDVTQRTIATCWSNLPTKIPKRLNLCFYKHSLLTEPSAPTARPPAGGSLRSPKPPTARFARPQPPLLAALATPQRRKEKKIVKIFPKKSEAKKFWRKKIVKIFSKIFFSIFQNFFP